MNVLSLITARGGSKGLPRKNVLPFAGRPLIAWTIAASLGSRLVSRTIVSTDDDEIAYVSRSFGAEVPFSRPPELSGDGVRHMPVVRHAVAWMEKNLACRPDYVMLLQPTSPLRTSEDIDGAIRMAAEKNAPAVVSVREVATPPCYCRQISADGTLADIPGLTDAEAPRQEIRPAFAENGAIFLIRRDVLFSQDSLIPKGSLAYLMPEERCADIDTPLHFRLAEMIMMERS